MCVCVCEGGGLNHLIFVVFVLHHKRYNLSKVNVWGVHPAHDSNLVSPQLLPGIVKSRIFQDSSIESQMILVDADWLSENNNQDIKVLPKQMNKQKRSLNKCFALFDQQMEWLGLYILTFCSTSMFIRKA